MQLDQWSISITLLQSNQLFSFPSMLRQGIIYSNNLVISGKILNLKKQVARITVGARRGISCRSLFL
jgi:hypothetical protein